MKHNDRSELEEQSHRAKDLKTRLAEREKRFNRDVILLSLLMTVMLVVLGITILARLREQT
jgi:hypothetical protein